MDDVLEVRLQRPSVPDLILIDRREQSFERTLRPGGAYEVAIIVVELLRPFCDMCVAGCEAEFIVGAFFAKPDELDPCIGVEVDQVAVGRRTRDSAEYANAAVVTPRYPVDLLFKDRPNSDVA